MNILSLFPLIPLVMMLGLWISKNTRQIHAVMVAGSSALLALAIYLVFHYLGLREAGATDAMLLTDSVVWYAPLNIHYAVGVDGISVACCTVGHHRLHGHVRLVADEERQSSYFPLVLPALGRCLRILHHRRSLLDVHVLRSGADPDVPAHRVWGSGRKEYSAMKLTLMLMGGSALLLCGILASTSVPGRRR